MLEQVVKPLSSGSILPWLTASRIVTTNSLSQLATPSSISSDQSLTLSGSATATVAGLITAQSALTVASTTTLQGVTTVIDGNFSIIGSDDSSKRLVVEVDAQSTGDTLTLSAGAQTDSRTLSIPVLTANATLAVLSETQTFTGEKTFSAATIFGSTIDVASTVTAANFFRCNRANSFDTTYCTFFTGCSTFPFFFDATGGMNWGDGTNPVDTILYRGAANQVRTTDQLYVQFSNDSTSVATGAIFTDGGIGVGKRLTLDGDTGKTLKYVNPTANAAVATTLGSVGPTGSTAGDPQGWIRVDINGTDRYIPFW